MFGLWHQRNPLGRVTRHEEKSSACWILTNVVFEDTVLHVARYLEYGLCFLELDPEMELPEASEDDSEFIHEVLELGPRLEAPVKR